MNFNEELRRRNSKIINHKIPTGYGIKVITHASGACNPSSILGSPTRQFLN